MSLILRSWRSQTTECRILKSFLFMKLVQFNVNYFDSDGGFLHSQEHAKWYPSWRVIEIE